MLPQSIYGNTELQTLCKTTVGQTGSVKLIRSTEKSNQNTISCDGIYTASLFFFCQHTASLYAI